MTRWARSKNKEEHDATSWDDLQIKESDRRPGRRMKSEEEISAQREKRLNARKERRKKARPCFHCRLPGHMAAQCPQKHDGNKEDICFKCGASDHNIYDCTAKVDKDAMPFASCFICKEKGHLSSKCPDNPRGLYPDGGGCRFCGSVEHYRRDCPERFGGQNQDTERKRTYKMRYTDQKDSIEAIDNSSGESSDEEAPKPKKPTKKVVKF